MLMAVISGRANDGDPGRRRLRYVPAALRF